MQQLTGRILMLCAASALVLGLAGCEDADKKHSAPSTVLPLDLAPLQMNYQRSYVQQQWGLPAISRKAPAELGEKLHYERYPLDGGEIQLFYKKDELWAYILRNYRVDQPAIEHWQQWWANDPAWTFGKDSFKALKHNVTLDEMFVTGRYRCRIDSVYFGAAGKYHHFYFASDDPEVSDKKAPTIQMETASEQPLCEQFPAGESREQCELQWKEIICAAGEHTLG